MAVTFTDMPLEQMRDYRPDLSAPDDLDDFWTGTLAEARAAAAPERRERVPAPVRMLRLDDLEFSGFGGDRVRGWVIRPDDDEVRPAIVEYIGYGGGRGLPGEKLNWASAGYVHVVMDTRGQGSVWGGGGGTDDPHGTGASVPGFMTRGILDPREYYYRRLYTDAARLVEVVAGWDDVDAARIAVTGGSQGGGVSLATAALAPGVAAVMPDVPFLCDFPRSITVTPLAPFTEITRYLATHREAVSAVLRTLSYVDAAVLAPRVTAPALFSVGLMDDVVMPSTVFAAFNRLGSREKAIEVYPFNGHEGGQPQHWHRQVAWLDDRFGMA
ncbi:MAG: acetylxylan esterase [Actinomycetales bacterium]|nr:acetylxylan esterase [Actinomycetales bacterium]